MDNQNQGRWGDQADGTYCNPILPGDYSDPDVIRVGEDYYLITSTFQLSPGMAIMHSRDLVNWQFIGHCIPDLTQISPELNWDRMNRYNLGVYAGSIRYHAGRFWMFFTTLDEGVFMTTADRPQGPWAPLHRLWNGKGLALDEPRVGWDDPCPLWDDDGKAYLLLSNPGPQWHTYLFPMSADGRTLEVERVFDLDSYTSSEGNKIYKIDGYYYVFHNECHGWENRIGVIMRSKSIYGPYEKRPLLFGAGEQLDREPNQGALIDTPDGRWFFVTHQGRGSFYEGRPTSLLPVKWVDGWPVIDTPEEQPASVMIWRARKPIQGYPANRPQRDDEFQTSELSPQWEWNHQPRAEKWSLTQRPGWLRLHAFPALTAGDLHKTGNILTQRVYRGNGQVTVRLDLSGLSDGQVAGICHFSKDSCELAVQQGQGGRTIYFHEVKTQARTEELWLGGNELYLRFEHDAQGISRGSYSPDGQTFIPLGHDHTLQFSDYRGDRLGLFTRNDCGEKGFVDVKYFRHSLFP